MVVVTDRQSGDLAVVLKLEDGHCVVEATDANCAWRMTTPDRTKAIEYYTHPYVFKSRNNTVMTMGEEDGA